MKKIKIYGPFLLGLGILLCISFFLPQVIFQMQDGYHFAGKSVKCWEVSDNGPVSADYERDMCRRVERLASVSADNLTVSAIDYGGKTVEEVVELLERVFASEWMGYINEMTFGIYYDFLQKTSTINIQDCKKYVVYENTSLEDILLMVWYVDIYMVDYDTTVRLVVDTETEMVYYIEIIGKSGQEKNYQDDMVKPTEYNKMAKLGIMAGGSYLMSYFNEYYEAHMEEIEVNGMVDGESKDMWYVTREDTEDGSYISYVLPYENVATEFGVSLKQGEGFLPDFAAGLVLIRDYIPEMIQN